MRQSTRACERAIGVHALSEWRGAAPYAPERLGKERCKADAWDDLPRERASALECSGTPIVLDGALCQAPARGNLCGRVATYLTFHRPLLLAPRSPFFTQRGREAASGESSIRFIDFELVNFDRARAREVACMVTNGSAPAK